MSNILYDSSSDYGYPGSPASGYDRQFVKEEVHRLRRSAQKVAWYNPAEVEYSMEGRHLRPDTIFAGEEAGMTPLFDDPAVDMAQYRKNKAYLRNASQNRWNLSSTEVDKALYSPYMGVWDEELKNYLDWKKHGSRSASGVIDSSDFTAIKVINVLAEIMGRDTRVYVLEQAVDRIATPNLTATIDTWKGFGISQNVGEAVRALPKKGSFTRASYELNKNIGLVMSTDESQLKSDKDILQEHVRQVGQAMRQAKATSIATALETFSDNSGSNWSAYTGEHNTADPTIQLGALRDTIEANGGNADTIASHAVPARYFLSNTAIKGSGTPSTDSISGNRILNGVQGLPGVTWYIDNLKTSTLVTIYDRTAVKLFQGPVRTAQFRDEHAGIDAYITRDWFTVQVVDSTRGADLTGVA